MLKSLPYRVMFSFLGAMLLPLLARIVLTALGASLTPQAYLLSFAIGTAFGYLLGLLLDKYLKTLKTLKRTNSALRQEIKEKTISEARYAALFEKNHSIILLINPITGTIVDANPSACAFYGYPIEKMKKMQI